MQNCEWASLWSGGGGGWGGCTWRWPADAGDRVPRGAARAGGAWSLDECALLVERLLAGMSVGDLATLLGRTAGAVQSRLARMIPAEEHVFRDAAAGWLIARFAADP